jgi:hypothetical protein
MGITNIAEDIFCPRCGWKPDYTYSGQEFDNPPQKCRRCSSTMKRKLILK